MGRGVPNADLVGEATTHRGSSPRCKADSQRVRSFAYVRVGFMELLASAPVSGADDTNEISAVRESDRENAIGHTAETVEARLGQTVLQVPGYDTTGIEECHLSFCKRHAVLPTDNTEPAPNSRR